GARKPSLAAEEQRRQASRLTDGSDAVLIVGVLEPVDRISDEEALGAKKAAIGELDARRQLRRWCRVVGGDRQRFFGGRGRNDRRCFGYRLGLWLDGGVCTLGRRLGRRRGQHRSGRRSMR